MGTKDKDWLEHEDARWLFKMVRSKPGQQSGEDWAEKIVEQLAHLLEVPVASVDLAVKRGHRGVVSVNFVPPEARLEHGNELLVRIDPSYDMDAGRRNDRYTVASVLQALADAQAPAELADQGFSAFDVWAGYLVLDAWVAGRDRHHGNWAVLAAEDRVLAPSFDHGNALGFQEPDARRAKLAVDPAGLAKWALKGRSPHFAGGPQLVDLAREADASMTPSVRGHWLARLAEIEDDAVQAVLAQVPHELMSEDARRFCRELLSLNQRRLCDVD